MGSFWQYFEFEGHRSSFSNVDTARLELENKFREQSCSRTKGKVSGGEREYRIDQDYWYFGIIHPRLCRPYCILTCTTVLEWEGIVFVRRQKARPDFLESK